MKKIITIMLLFIVVFPVIWNAASLVHYLVEHTHVFCANKEHPQHFSLKECHSICTIQYKQDQHTQKEHPNTQRIEFQEIKQYFSPFSISLEVVFPLFLTKAFCDKGFSSQDFVKAIFRPPPSAN